MTEMLWKILPWAWIAAISVAIWLFVVLPYWPWDVRGDPWELEDEA